jgi:hypothetical protein
MLHETTIHRADAELALDRDPKISVDVATDGIDEFFVNLPGAAALIAPNLNKLSGDGERMGLIAMDIAAKWLLTLRPDGLDWRYDDSHEDGHGDSRVDDTESLTVRADAADLLLFVWGRRKPGDAHLEIIGDNALLAHWTENSAI